eukprot:3661048-Rhodomonas_salina.1
MSSTDLRPAAPSKENTTASSKPKKSKSESAPAGQVTAPYHPTGFSRTNPSTTVLCSARTSLSTPVLRHHCLPCQDLTINQPFNVPQWRFTPLKPDPRGVTLSPYDRAPQVSLRSQCCTQKQSM